ncbi:MAG: NAD-dependent epimerase/dehydratase family protein [Polyangia bacterium]
MKPIALVTGGTGFLGAHLVRGLVERGERVRVLSRGGGAEAQSLSELGVEVVQADVVRDFEGATPLARAVEGCATLYHLAGFVSRQADDGQRMMRVHVDGTRRVLEAARAAGVRRVVLASTSGTIAVSSEPELLDERAPYPTELVSGWPYYLSKIYQEKLALDLCHTLGLELVVVNPSLLLGPGDHRDSSTGDVKKFLRREIPVVPPGGMSFVDVRDAAQATLSAMERGRPGERYLLGGPNWTVAEFFGRLERVAKVRGPRLKLPKPFQLGAASFLEHAYAALKKTPPVERISVEMSHLFWYCDSSKAERELGFVSRDPGETLDETVRDLRRRMI